MQSCTLFLQLRCYFLLGFMLALSYCRYLLFYFTLWISCLGLTNTFFACKLFWLCSFYLNCFCWSFVLFLTCNLGNNLLKLINAVKSLLLTILIAHKDLFENFRKWVKRIYGAGKNISFCHIVLLLAVRRIYLHFI